MTDQRKIPLPDNGENPEVSQIGGSLFERATKAFDLSGLAPAKVPARLAPPPAKRLRASSGQQPASVEPVQEVPAPPVVSTAPTEPAEPVIVPDPVPAMAEPIHFSGPSRPIDRDRLHELGMIEPDGEVTTLLEEFRIVKRQIIQQVRNSTVQIGAKHTQRVLICSPHSGEGKTFCAVNLALSIAAERDSEVLLVDADFGKPSILSTLGLPGGPGLMDALADPAIRVEDCVIRTDLAGLSVLPAGNRTNSDSEYLSSGRADAVLDRLTQGAPNRIVIFDSPPVLAASPAAELAKYVGQAVLVVRADSTGQSAVEDAVSLLSGCPDIKLLLNSAHFSPSGRRFGSYYGYGG